MAQVVEVTDSTFMQEVIDASTPVLVDFWAPWCGPCRAVAPVMEELAGQYAGRMKIAKMNVDENQGVAQAMQVRSIPTVAVFHGKNVLAVEVGAYPKAAYAQMIDAILEKTATPAS